VNSGLSSMAARTREPRSPNLLSALPMTALERRLIGNRRCETLSGAHHRPAPQPSAGILSLAAGDPHGNHSGASPNMFGSRSCTGWVATSFSGSTPNLPIFFFCQTKTRYGAAHPGWGPRAGLGRHGGEDPGGLVSWTARETGPAPDGGDLFWPRPRPQTRKFDHDEQH